jgi:UDPglucose 6-dehydrogenase
LRRKLNIGIKVVKINDNQKQRFAQKVIDHFDGHLNGKRIAILGWAFKANTNDSRESASIKVSEILYKNGASITIYDPMVQKISIENDIENLWETKDVLNDKRINIVGKNKRDQTM